MLKTFSALILLAVITSCTPNVKKNEPVSNDLRRELESLQEPTAEQEAAVKIIINFDGKWRKASTGSKAIILIKGKTGRVIGRNGAEIPIVVKYINERTIRILEPEYNPRYLSNWLPEEIAQQIYLNDLVKSTQSILRIINDDTLVGTSYAWQVMHHAGMVQKIEPFVSSEEWQRIKE